MRRSFEFRVDKNAQSKAIVQFYHFYGHALARWAELEGSLYNWFAHTTGMSDGMARAIFYGARGFAARSEMLEAAIEHATILSPAEVAFLKEAMKKARGYSGFRNKIAHGEPRLNVIEKPDDTSLHYTLVQGKHKPSLTEPTITVEELSTPANNIHLLAKCIRDMLPEKHPNAEPPEECLALVLGLPTEPNEQSDQTAKEPAPPPQGLLHRNKKEYRARQKVRKEGSWPRL
jgi:hypothetical protein